MLYDMAKYIERLAYYAPEYDDTFVPSDDYYDNMLSDEALPSFD